MPSFQMDTWQECETMNVQLFNSRERWQIFQVVVLTQVHGGDTHIEPRSDTCMQTHQFTGARAGPSRAKASLHTQERSSWIKSVHRHTHMHARTHTHTFLPSCFYHRFHCVNVPLCVGGGSSFSPASAAALQLLWFFSVRLVYSCRSLRTRPSTTKGRKKNNNKKKKSMACLCICQWALAALLSLGQQAARGQL